MPIKKFPFAVVDGKILFTQPHSLAANAVKQYFE